MPRDAITSYLESIRRELGTGRATEHTYRPALKSLIESFSAGIIATNEPKRVRCGAPDFIVSRGQTPVGYIEAKDIAENLDKVERSEQLRRYLDSLGNLILTDYLEFRWYLNGEIHMTGRLARVSPTGKLRRDPEGVEAVSKLVKEFLSAQIPSIGSYKELAARMAAVAKLLREIISTAFEDEDEAGSLHAQLLAFKKVLLRDLKPDRFSDMYAQTITYGQLAAVFNHDKSKQGRFTRETAAYSIPKTNPFLIEMFDYIAGPRLDDRLTWAVDRLAELLNTVKIRALKEDFQKLTGKEDPVYHLYETFLAGYDPKMREARGVYYTPEPVVSYIVRSVDHILKEDFGLADGLADTTKIKLDNGQECHKVLLLDPACGTGTFLHGVIAQIHGHLVRKGQAGLWSSYVSAHLLPRIFGFELLMAPYAVAHMKLGLQLQETGYDFKSGERLRIYLTNTLEEAFKVSQLDVPFADMIAREAESATQIKTTNPVMVILGNPPYEGHSANKGEWITALVDDYKQIGGEKLRLGQAKWLQNDYVKFIRFAQHKITRTGYGILAMITDHSYIDSGTFVGMRASLQASFDKLFVLDLHGNAKKNRNRADFDENIFDITQGVCILIAVRSPKSAQTKWIGTYGYRGSKAAKESILDNRSVDSTPWKTDPYASKPPFYLFVPSDLSHLREYERYMSIRDAMPGSYADDRAKRIGTGFVSTHDDLAISFSASDVKEKIHTFLSTSSEAEARAKFRLCSQSQWNYQRAKAALAVANWDKQVRKVLYRPFDWRYTVWNKNVCVHRRERVHSHLRGDNIILCVGQAGNVIGFDEWDLAYVSAFPVDFNCFYRGGCAALPLYLYPDGPLPSRLFGHEDGRRANLSKEFVRVLCGRLKTVLRSDQIAPSQRAITPESILHFSYSCLYSSGYRDDYSPFLMLDFPRVPVPRNMDMFQELEARGQELIELHLMTKNAPVQTRYPVSGDNRVEKVRYTEPGQGAETGRVWINKTQFFEDVPLEVWSFHIGGYQVCHKWLKDRKGRLLSYDDLTHYQRVVSALARTIELMAEIDQVIHSHGGWPLQ